MTGYARSVYASRASASTRFDVQSAFQRDEYLTARSGNTEFAPVPSETRLLGIKVTRVDVTVFRAIVR